MKPKKLIFWLILRGFLLTPSYTFQLSPSPPKKNKYSICGCQVRNFPSFGNPFSTHENGPFGGFLRPFIHQRWSEFDEIFTRDSILVDKNTLWIIFPKFEFLRKWDRSKTLTPSCTPFPPEYGQNQGKSKQSVKKCSHQAIQICQSQDSFFSPV